MRSSGWVYIVVVESFRVVMNIQHIQCAPASLLIVPSHCIQEPGQKVLAVMVGLVGRAGRRIPVEMPAAANWAKQLGLRGDRAHSAGVLNILVANLIVGCTVGMDIIMSRAPDVRLVIHREKTDSILFLDQQVLDP